ncbi:hypothetical protein BV898_09071 [Hypsibius exemplaris]|nr:hypothetical protein BV898_09071 [Hypsibius exemplaris]
MRSAVNGEPYPTQPLTQQLKEEVVKVTNHCAVCDRVFVQLSQWKDHMASNTHKRRANSKRKKEKALITLPESVPTAVIPQSSWASTISG